ncbi:hypothetical protein [Roseicella aquatilis]|uniref:Uncharacterized protein n=1 Tax=Roseicella aquatilis TaxID=2527868 RepID=A0A4R4DRI5_9PROT|nr:hypothetical protein [Roseicella aquatilis]TCZ63978.1 hypothetical protein EXY23_08345 [Roseicella aquatilis]
MASFNPRKFADPDRLRGIAPARLEAFMAPWRGYLLDRDFVFPASTLIEIDYAGLADILMRPDAATPGDMVDALYYVQETASAEDMDQLLAAVRARGLMVTDDPAATPIDLAIDVWRVAPEVVRAHHAEAIAMRQQNFEYFGPGQPVRGAFPGIDAELRQRLESEFDDWFESHRRGRGCRMFVIRHTPMTWILVRHGQPTRREASQKDDGGVGTEFYRPQRHDVLIFDERSGDLGVHASTKGERNLYLRTLGRHLFSGEEHFPPAGRFTLDPLIADGSEALNVEDVDGIKGVRLVEYRRYWGGVYRETETRKAEDIFAALADRNIRTLAGGRLNSATFKVAFEDSEKERSVTIRPPGIARYERNDDSELIEQWLRRRGFILSGQRVDDDEAATAVLEGV